jgi:superfamily II DNA or RNA helicase
MAKFDDFYATLDADQQVRGKQFEHFVKWFLQTDPEWKSQIDQLWLWDDYPQRWGTDCGIDLVFRDKSGKDWAVQAKCVHPDREISKAEIESFISESNDPRIHGRLLIATTDGIGRNARQMINRQEKQVVCFLLDNFRKAEVDFPTSAKALAKGRRKEPRKPRPHQVLAVRDVVKGFKSASRGQLIMACGTGKTLTSLWIKEKLKAQQVLVLVPSLSLLSQTLREWTAAAKTPFSWICVCSDTTVAKQDQTEDAWFSHVSDIGVPVTGDTKEIQGFLRRPGVKVVFSTYQSSPLIADAQKDRKTPEFDIVFADEAHRCAGNVSEAFGCVLNAKRIRSNRLLFMTATPRILSKQIKNAAEGQGIDVSSMDDHAVFGKVLHQLKFSQAIEQELLSDYRVLVVGVDDSMVQQRIRNRDLLRTSNGVELDAETLATHIALTKAVKDYDLRRVISFHGRVKGAQAFAADHKDVLAWVRKSDRPSGSTMTDYVSGDMNSGERNTKINRLRHLGADERGILSNARCLSEGVDVPSLDGVAFIDPRKSQVDIVQAVGRAIRKSAGKTHGTIVIPLFIDADENEHEALESSRFKPIWDVVNALRSHDDDLAQELDELRISLGQRNPIRGKSDGLKKVVFDLPVMCEQSFIDGLRTVLVERTTSSWIFGFGLLQQYCERNGDARPPQSYKTTDRFALGVWVTTQRKKRESLSQDRIARLELLKGWSWDPHIDQWNDGYQALKEYVAESGHARPPSTFKTIDGFKLGGWVSEQRSTRESRSQDRIARLESLKGWTWDSPTARWNDGYQALQEYATETGNARPSKSYRTTDGYALGDWVAVQRQKREILSQDRIARLESLQGWSWNALLDQWNESYQALAEYVSQKGDARPPQNYKTIDGLALGGWVTAQRHKRESLSQDRTARLESLRGWTWERHTAFWHDGYEALMAYVAQNGDARPPSTFRTTDGFKLGAWTFRQRQSRESLSQDRIALLESLKGWSWDPFVDQWNEGYQALTAYVAQNGDARPPRSIRTTSGIRLESWVSQQRQKRESLSHDRIARLESLKGWSWDLRIDQWNDGYQALMAYVAQNGDARPLLRYKTVDGFQLGGWISIQRQTRDSLSQDRIARLESLKGWSWDPHTDQWNDGYQALKEYVAKSGDARPPSTFRTTEGFKLGGWINRQRQSRESLSLDRIARLESLKGWIWDPFVDQWNDSYQALTEYVAQNPDARPTANFKTTDGFALGSWVSGQRTKRESLSQDQMTRLESLNGWSWDPRADQWNDGYQALKEYVAESGHARPPNSFRTSDGFALGGWLSRQLQTRELMSQDRIALLESLKGWSWGSKLKQTPKDTPSS